ncbi:MAG TPA: hypothetical protein VGV09_09650 [Steroidobacteraceae bacterium]|nr:hypothetical protein [Steroidobacteraceae bacterium]
MRKINHCAIFAGAALLAACATQAPAPTQTSAEKFNVPVGFRKAMVNGQEEYCRNDVDTGSRISRTTTCYTLAQLKAEQANNQNNLSNEIQNNNSLNAGMGVHQVGPNGR